MWLHPRRGELPLARLLKAERVGVAVPSDELRVGVKGLSNHELAGSPRNTYWRDPFN